jgi:hypothetical protein
MQGDDDTNHSNSTFLHFFHPADVNTFLIQHTCV